MDGAFGEMALKEAPEASVVGGSLGELAKRAAKDDQAFRELYERMKRPIYNFLYRMVGHMGEAEELMQDTLLKVYRSLDRLNAEENFMAWSYTIARNTAISHLRKRRWVPQPLEQMPEPVSSARGHEEKDVESDLQRLLLEIPPRYRSLFIMAVIEQREYREIAKATGKSLASVKADVHRAREMMRDRWKRYREGTGVGR
ncbi:MAG: RNA polymerase sigma factor [Acidobacteriota bacterium]